MKTFINLKQFFLTLMQLFLFLAWATVAGAETATVTWTDNSGKNPVVNDQESGFEIYRNLNGDAFTLIVTTAADSQFYSDATLTADNAVDNRYCYRVRAVNAAGVSGYADTATPGTTDCKVIPRRVLVIPANPSGQLVK